MTGVLIKRGNVDTETDIHQVEYDMKVGVLQPQAQEVVEARTGA